MSRDELYEALVSLLNSMSNEDARAVFNEYCSEYGSLEDYIYDNDEYDLNEYFGEDSPYEVLCRTGYGDYNISHDYFRTDGYGNVRSFNNVHSDESPFYADELADYIIDNENALGNSDIEDLLDEYNESNDEFEESVRRNKRTNRISESSRRKRNRRKWKVYYFIENIS